MCSNVNPQKFYTDRVMPKKISAITDLEISIVHVNLGPSWYQKMLLSWEPQLIPQMAKLS